jgi:hypothetical protein
VETKHPFPDDCSELRYTGEDYPEEVGKDSTYSPDRKYQGGFECHEDAQENIHAHKLERELQVGKCSSVSSEEDDRLSKQRPT